MDVINEYDEFKEEDPQKTLDVEAPMNLILADRDRIGSAITHKASEDGPAAELGLVPQNSSMYRNDRRRNATLTSSIIESLVEQNVNDEREPDILAQTIYRMDHRRTTKSDVEADQFMSNEVELSRDTPR